MTKRLAVLASGEGTNLEAILEAVDRGAIAAAVVLVVSDREGAPALKRAGRRGVRSSHIDPRGLERVAYDRLLLEALREAGTELVALAGFMRLLSPLFIETFPARVLNIHPSLLPAFPGENAVEKALAYGVKVSGCTVHLVEEGLDSGPIILQEAVPVIQEDNAATLHRRIHAAEYRLYPRALDLVCREKIAVEGRKCVILE